jgi:hypothetical protein
MRSTLPFVNVCLSWRAASGACTTCFAFVKNTSLTKVFTLIEKQAGVSFFYRVEALRRHEKLPFMFQMFRSKMPLTFALKISRLFTRLLTEL